MRWKPHCATGSGTGIRLRLMLAGFENSNPRASFIQQASLGFTAAAAGLDHVLRGTSIHDRCDYRKYSNRAMLHVSCLVLAAWPTRVQPFMCRMYDGSSHYAVNMSNIRRMSNVMSHVTLVLVQQLYMALSCSIDTTTVVVVQCSTSVRTSSYQIFIRISPEYSKKTTAECRLLDCCDLYTVPSYDRTKVVLAAVFSPQKTAAIAPYPYGVSHIV